MFKKKYNAVIHKEYDRGSGHYMVEITSGAIRGTYHVAQPQHLEDDE